MDKEKKTAYDMKYNAANIIQRKITFNRRVAEDMELLAIWDSKENATQWIKDLIRREAKNMTCD